jgi:hypothetical protein
MVVDDEQEDAGMEEDNAKDEAADVCDKEDLSLLEAFKAGLDLDANGPPLGFIDDYWFAEPDGDDETSGPITVCIRTAKVPRGAHLCILVPGWCAYQRLCRAVFWVAHGKASTWAHGEEACTA